MQLGRILELVTKQMAVAVSLCSRDFLLGQIRNMRIGSSSHWTNLGHPIAELLGMAAFNALRQHFERVLHGKQSITNGKRNFGVSDKDGRQRPILLHQTPTVLQTEG